MKNAFAVIMAGGRGERFWPLSTSRTPKQMLSLVGGKPLVASVFARAADRASEWLVVRATDDQARWTRNTHLGIPHVYNSRSAWALLQANVRKMDPDWERVARANLDWSVANEHGGWFEQCAFEPGVAPFTHTIAYAIRGLWENDRDAR